MAEFHRAQEAHVERLNRAIDVGGVARLRKVYDQAQGDLERKITKSIKRSSSPFTVQQYRLMLAQLRQGQIEIARHLGDASAAATIETQTAAIQSLVATVKRIDKQHGTVTDIRMPIEEIARFAGVTHPKRSSLLVQNRASMAVHGAKLIRSLEGELAQSLAAGETNGDAIDRVAKRGDMEFWRAERIVRTEQAYAFNATQHAAVHETAKSVGQLYERWTELVTDSGSPMDDRVGADSVAMHGQVARPGESFVMPPWAATIHLTNRYGKSKVGPDLLGGSWDHPPNRPNDRATLMPWRPEWGVPGWRVEGGVRVEVRPVAPH